MKSITLLPAFIFLLFCLSCKQNPTKNNLTAKPEVPKPLQDENKDISFLSKSRGEDLLDGIYADLVSKTPELQSLEDGMKHFEEGHADSLRAFTNYDLKSGNYYESALAASDKIKDTVLKQRLRIILISSQKSYAGKKSRFTSLIDKIEKEQLSEADYYLTLKVAATLPVIEDYQDKNLPGKSVEAIALESEKLKLTTQKLAEKYKNKADVKK